MLSKFRNKKWQYLVAKVKVAKAVAAAAAAQCGKVDGNEIDNLREEKTSSLTNFSLHNNIAYQQH